MKAFFHSGTMIRIPLTLILFVLCSCSDDTSSPESDWENIGVQQVMVDQITVPGTISWEDTLSVEMSGSTETTGILTLSSIDDVRITDTVTLTVWAEVRKWVGTGVMPTIDPTVQCTYKAVPPFDAGMFYIVIGQPDGSQAVDSVMIID